MKLFVRASGVALLAICLISHCHGQLGIFSKEQLVDFTHTWKGERFPDGRPKVSDELMDRLKAVNAEGRMGCAYECRIPKSI